MCGDGLDVTIIFYEDLLFGAPFTGGNYVSTTTEENLKRLLYLCMNDMYTKPATCSKGLKVPSAVTSHI